MAPHREYSPIIKGCYYADNSQNRGKFVFELRKGEAQNLCRAFDRAAGANPGYRARMQPAAAPPAPAAAAAAAHASSSSAPQPAAQQQQPQPRPAPQAPPQQKEQRAAVDLSAELQRSKNAAAAAMAGAATASGKQAAAAPLPAPAAAKLATTGEVRRSHWLVLHAFSNKLWKTSRARPWDLA
jgi:hypothetical protein